MPSKVTEIYVRAHRRNILVSIATETDEFEPQADVVEPEREPEPAVSVEMDVHADGAVDLNVTKTMEADINVDGSVDGWLFIYITLLCPFECCRRR